MKKILYVITAACLLLSSCDLERRPYTGYTDSELKSDPDALDLMLVGCYGQLRTMGDHSSRAGEYPGDNMMKDKSSTDAFMQFIDYVREPADNRAYRAKYIWDQCYKIIAQTSDIMKIVGENPASEEIAHNLGEAYFLRGMSYFYAVRVFGRPYYQSPETNLGVPIINGQPEDILADNIEIPDRATVKEVYEQVISDLKEAERLMTINKANIRATKEAAQALLSRVYLYMSGTYESPNTSYADLAIEYANKVIASKRFVMRPRAEILLGQNASTRMLSTPTPENNKEAIFAIKFTDNDSKSNYYGSMGGMYSYNGNSGWNEIYASAKYIDRLRHSGGDAKNVVGPNAADVRGNFIRPYYTGWSAAGGPNLPGVPPASGEDVFRVIVDRYSAGVLTGFLYRQFSLDNGDAVVKDANNNITERYPLTAVGDRYTFSYKPEGAPAAVTYIGDIDKRIEEQMGYPKFSIFKCSGENSFSQLHSPIVVRLAEMYLNLAEAYAKKGDFANALTNINVVRDRSVVGNSITMADITAHAADVIDNERALELAWESHRAYDVFRIGKTMEHRYPAFFRNNNNLVNIPATHSTAVQVLSQKTIDDYSVFGTLTQNPITDLPAPDLTPYTPFIPY